MNKFGNRRHDVMGDVMILLIHGTSRDHVF